VDYYQPHPRQHRNRNPTFPKEPKIDLPPFRGREDVQEYLDWEMKVELIFESHQVNHDRRVSLATLSFQGSAMYWWTSFVRDLTIHNSPKKRYYNELRWARRKRHVPSYYGWELMNRLQQKNISVEEYRQKMELLLIKAGIKEEPRITIARFQSGLNYDIQDRVELLSHNNLG